jgi:hypothetical protein
LALATGCGSAIVLGVDPSEPAPVESLPAPQLSKNVYRKILLLPPTGQVDVKNVEFDVARSTDPARYVRRIEKGLLGAGFEVIASEVVARAAKAGSQEKLSAGEKAMVLGKNTRADAVLMVESISVRGLARYFDADEAQTIELEASRVMKDEDGEWLQKENEECVHRLPYYEVRIGAKLLDTRSGAVLWVGSARGTSIDVIHDRWEAEVDSDCRIVDQNFAYSDYQADETTFNNTVSTLVRRLLTAMSRPALAGRVIEDDKPAPPPPPPPPPKVEEPPKKKMAVVSSKRASLRNGPSRRDQRKMTVSRKSKVEVLETMGEWHKVKAQDGTTGWMHESTLILADD